MRMCFFIMGTFSAVRSSVFLGVGLPGRVSTSLISTSMEGLFGGCFSFFRGIIGVMLMDVSRSMEPEDPKVPGYAFSKDVVLKITIFIRIFSEFSYITSYGFFKYLSTNFLFFIHRRSFYEQQILLLCQFLKNSQKMKIR
jgi:hypothetical protein